jgi:hypothetical protein
VWRVQIHAKVAQLVEHSTENAGVVGSIPSLGTFVFGKEAASLSSYVVKLWYNSMNFLTKHTARKEAYYGSTTPRTR